MSKKSGKKVLLLLFGITLIFFIIPVEGQVINGGFETGDLTGWSQEESGTGSIIVHQNFAYNSNYGVELYAYSTGTGSWKYRDIYQTVNMTGISAISFDYKVSGAGYACFFIDDTSNSYDLTLTDWSKKVVDLSGYSGMHTIRFRSQANINNHKYLYVDNTELIENCTINYNPDIPVSDTKPFELSYILNSEYVGQYCEIYSYTGTDIGNETHPNIIWSRGFVSDTGISGL